MFKKLTAIALAGALAFTGGFSGIGGESRGMM